MFTVRIQENEVFFGYFPCVDSVDELAQEIAKRDLRKVTLLEFRVLDSVVSMMDALRQGQLDVGIVSNQLPEQSVAPDQALRAEPVYCEQQAVEPKVLLLDGYIQAIQKISRGRAHLRTRTQCAESSLLLPAADLPYKMHAFVASPDIPSLLLAMKASGVTYPEIENDVKYFYTDNTRPSERLRALIREVTAPVDLFPPANMARRQRLFAQYVSQTLAD